MASEHNMNASTVAKKIAASAVASVPSTAAIPEIKAAIEKAIINAPAVEGVAVVDVKSAWLSKINLGQVVGIGAMLATFFGFDLDAETKAQIEAAIVALMGVYTWIMKTFFTSTVHASSLPKGA